MTTKTRTKSTNKVGNLNRALEIQAYNYGVRQVMGEASRGLKIGDFQNWIEIEIEVWGVDVTITASQLWGAYQTGMAEQLEKLKWRKRGTEDERINTDELIEALNKEAK